MLRNFKAHNLKVVGSNPTPVAKKPHKPAKKSLTWLTPSGAFFAFLVIFTLTFTLTFFRDYQNILVWNE